MINFKKTDLKKNTLQFDISIPKKDIQKEYEKSFEKMTGELSVEGFRKGKAPKNIAQKHINSEKVYNEAINALLPAIYSELVTQEKLRPVVAPKVELLEAKANEDWKVRFIVAEKPKIDLRDYKKDLEKIRAEDKKDALWTPGKDKKPVEEKVAEAAKREQLNKIFEALIKTSNVEISDIIIEQELNKKLTQIVDDVEKIGLTMDSYLTSKNETLESIKAKLTKEIEDMYKLEYILEEIADQEKITADPADLEALFAEIKDEKARDQARQNAYFYASLVRRQKTLDYLGGRK